MRANDIRARLLKQPVEPIRLFVSDGATYDIRHPEMTLVGPTEVVIAVGGSRARMPERLAYVDPVHITRIEPINGSHGKAAGRRKPKREE